MNLKRSNSSSNVQPKSWTRYLKIGLIVFFIVIVAEVLIVNRLSTYGDQIQDLQDKKAELELENILLQEEIAKNMGLKVMDEKVRQFGFEEPKKVEYIR